MGKPAQTTMFNDRGALFSKSREHRFCLWRTWDESKPKVMFIGLNPSSADETDMDHQSIHSTAESKRN